MKFFMSFLFLLSISQAAVFAQPEADQSHWKRLQEAAQAVGLCIYMSNMPDDRCECLQHNGSKSYTAPLSRGWARTRMVKWMMKRGQLPQKAVLVYDKYTNTSERGGELQKGFFIFSLDELKEVTLRSITEKRHVLYFKSKGQKKAILNNNYWREFFQKKEGRALDEGIWFFHGVSREKAQEFVALLNGILAGD